MMYQHNCWVLLLGSGYECDTFKHSISLISKKFADNDLASSSMSSEQIGRELLISLQSGFGAQSLDNN